MSTGLVVLGVEVLRLLAENDQLRAEVEKLRRGIEICADERYCEPHACPRQTIQALQAEVERLRIAVGHHPRTCLEVECSECSIDVCPHADPLHEHHDGCPSCWAEERELIHAERRRCAEIVREVLHTLPLSQRWLRISEGSIDEAVRRILEGK